MPLPHGSDLALIAEHILHTAAAAHIAAIKPAMGTAVEIKTRERKILVGPPCETCAGPTRIVRIEPHKRRKRRHVWTLECLACGAPQTAEMPKPPCTH